VLYLVGETKPELGGSEYYRLMGFLGSSVPRLEAEETVAAYGRLTAAMDAGCVRACHDLSEGGLAVSLAESAFTGGLGLEVDIGKVPARGSLRDDISLFSESNGRLIVEVPDADAKAFEALMGGSTFRRIGAVVDKPRLMIVRGGERVVERSLDELIGAWKTPLEARR
jgi:phosphoribosylformylglycinamidine (FGAM) synthase-like enzyme